MYFNGLELYKVYCSIDELVWILFICSIMREISRLWLLWTILTLVYSNIYTLVGSVFCYMFSDMEPNRYSVEQLLTLKPAFNMALLPMITKLRIRFLGIKRKFRGTRGKIARKIRYEKWRARKVI